MSISLINSFFSLLIINRVNGVCDSSQFFPCACCDAASHHCVHQSAKFLGQFSKCSIFKVFNPSCKLDTSIYCCIPTQLVRREARPNNITLFNKYCRKSQNLNVSFVNTIIPSCDPISKRCYNAKHSLKPVPPSTPMFIPPSNNKQQIEDVTSSVVIFDHKNNDDTGDKEGLPNDIEEDESSEQSNENKNEEDINTSRSVVEFQSPWSLILILITFVLFTTH